MTKYVLANVDIPIKINEDGKIESLHSYAQIEIIKEIDSPEDIIKDLPSISDQIDKMFSKNEKKIEEEREPEIIVLKKDIKFGKNEMLNTTFKNKNNYKHNKTAKQK